MYLFQRKYPKFKCLTTRLWKWIMGVGVGHSSEEASNDRGAKGRQISNSFSGETMTVHSIDGEGWRTQLERIGDLARRKPETVFNNVGYCINLENLMTVYREIDGAKAVGIDGMTKERYGQRLIPRLEDLIRRIRSGNYHPKPARMTTIPKEDESTRPLAISCFEDKLVQSIIARILNRIFEPTFLPCSRGFRPEHSCHQALRSLRGHIAAMKDGAVVEIDIRKCFNSIPHIPLRNILEERISDRRFLDLLDRVVKTPLLEEGKVKASEIGCPQGSIISPILANVYLHTVIDCWFRDIKRTHLRGRAEMVRYADDMVFIFESYSDAERFYRVLPKRLCKFGLEMHQAKSQLLKSGEMAASRAALDGERMGSYKFLGFICYWGQSRNGRWRLKYKSRADRFTAKLKGLREYLWKNLNTRDTDKLLKRMAAVVRGWVNYHAISDNSRRVGGFLHKSRWLIYKWFNRRGGRRRATWERLMVILRTVGFPERYKLASMFGR